MAIDTLEYPELHDESIPTLAFIKSLNRLLIAAGVKDFNLQVGPVSLNSGWHYKVQSFWKRMSSTQRPCLLQDLYKPDSNRLRRNLSGIINFAKFREEKLVPYTDMQESVEHLLEDTAELEELNSRLVHILHTQNQGTHRVLALTVSTSRCIGVLISFMPESDSRAARVCTACLRSLAAVCQTLQDLVLAQIADVAKLEAERAAQEPVLLSCMLIDCCMQHHADAFAHTCFGPAIW